MAEKLDPRLLELVQAASGDAAAQRVATDVLVALDAPIDDRVRRELTDRGLRIRSEIGTIVTGSINVGDARRLARSARVVKVEASGPMYQDAGPEDLPFD